MNNGRPEHIATPRPYNDPSFQMPIKNHLLMSHTAFLCLLVALRTSCSYNLGAITG